MKIMMVGDLHTGIGNDDPWLHDIIKTTFRKMVDYSKANGITTWIQSGDWFDVRKAITHSTMEFNRTVLIPMLEDAGITVYITVGNHDLHFKNKITPNSPREVLSQYDCVKVIDTATTVDFDGVYFDLIPWMCDQNKSEILNHIKTSGASYCVGHWELSGYYFYKNMKSEGVSADFLKKYTRVFSGHFHTISDGGNVSYIGTPYTITANDENDPRGWWVFDTKTETEAFIPNDVTYHVRVVYPGESEIDVEALRGRSVRLVATKEDNGLTKLENAIEAVAHSLKVIRNLESTVTNETGVIEVKNALDMIYEYLDEQNLDPVESEAVKRHAKELFTEATSG